MDRVTEGQSAALVRGFVTALHGKEIGRSWLDEVGPLRALLVDRDGWRPDGLARARTALSGAIDGWASTTTETFLKGVTPEDVANVLRARIGISGRPVSDARAAEALRTSRTELPSRQMVNNWVADRSRHPAFRQLLDVAVSRIGDVAAEQERSDVGGLPSWGMQFGAWPPRRWRAPQPVGEREVLLACAERTFARTCPPELVDEPCDRGELLDALRSAVHDYLVRHYFDDDENSTQLRYFERDVAPAWIDAGLIEEDGPPELLRKAKYSTELHAGVARVTQMHFHLIASGMPGFEELLAESVAIGRARDQLSALVVTDHPLEILPSVHGRPSVAIAGTGVPARAPARTVRPARFQLLHENELDPEQCLKHALDIREAPSEEKPALIDVYLMRRRESHEGTDVRFLLADLSVQLDLVMMRDEVRARDLIRHIRRGFQSQDWMSYSVLAFRNVSLLLNKSSDHSRALRQLADGYNELVRKVDEGLILDRKMIDETLHQIALAITGVHLTIVEAYLLSADNRRLYEALPNAIEKALWWSSRTMAALDRLDAPDRQPLAEERYSDRYLASTAWRVPTRLLNLEVLLAARTALLAGLAHETSRLHPFDFDLHAIEAAYRDLVVTKDLKAESVPAVVKLAIWVASLMGGDIPVELYPSPGLKKVAVLDPGPRLVEELGLTSFPLDFGGAEALLSGAGYEARPLSQVPFKGRVFGTLNSCSEGRFGEWRVGTTSSATASARGRS